GKNPGPPTPRYFLLAGAGVAASPGRRGAGGPAELGRRGGGGFGEWVVHPRPGDSVGRVGEGQLVRSEIGLVRRDRRLPDEAPGAGGSRRSGRPLRDLRQFCAGAGEVQRAGPYKNGPPANSGGPTWFDRQSCEDRRGGIIRSA